MEQLIIPRWEWRAFAPAFEGLDRYTPAEFETAHDTYVLSQSSDANVKIRNDTIDVKRRQEVKRGLELWCPVFKAAFPICQREAREVLRHLEVSPPAAYFSPVYDALTFTTDLAAAAPGARIIGVGKVRRQRPLEDCLLEQTTLSVAGHTMHSVAIEAADPDAVLRLVHSLRLERFENQSYVTFLQRLLGMRDTAKIPASLEDAHHEHLPLFHARGAGDAVRIARTGPDPDARR